MSRVGPQRHWGGGEGIWKSFAVRFRESRGNIPKMDPGIGVMRARVG